MPGFKGAGTPHSPSRFHCTYTCTHPTRLSASSLNRLCPFAYRKQIAEGFNEAKPSGRTATVAIDISKAFDSVNHTLLLDSICDTHLHPNLVHWVATYLRGRQACVTWQGVSSPWRNVKTGVPQGSVLGPVLFNFFVSDCPVVDPSYADDFTISRTAQQLDEIERLLQQDVDAVAEWAERKMLRVEAPKSSITYFTPDRARESNVHPQVSIGGVFLPLLKNPKILGVHFDTHFCFHTHAKEKAKSVNQKLRILRAIAGSGWGCQKETLLRVYKTYVEPTVNYAAAIWSPNASSSSFTRLQRSQNRALRIATGCHASASESHLHYESQVVPVADHLKMLSSQYLVSALRPIHPSHAVVTAPSGPRNMKASLSSKHLLDVSPHLTDGVVDPVSYPTILKSIHTSSVASSIAALGNNRLLGAPPPPISTSEISLSRGQRTTLSQLRSGFCKLLNDYRLILKKTTSAICPECLIRRHTATHLFNCDAVPTDLSLRDLWTNLVDVMNFLLTLPSFASLVPPDPHPPPPPPEPPP